jgi:hypothetical protein
MVCGAPHAEGVWQNCPFPYQQPGLGDQVEGLLASIGITKDRYAAAKELFGLPPTCSCSSRQEWLNKISVWWRSIGRESG